MHVGDDVEEQFSDEESIIHPKVRDAQATELRQHVDTGLCGLSYPSVRFGNHFPRISSNSAFIRQTEWAITRYSPCNAAHIS